ncbi:MAG: EscU/YscU/HrcU family type III secretion system export apparatus switch protein [Desulfobacterales bacterium]|nr:EscU/YscU/HrcU family type III secretion system export apparatus switch protein [Desulfobacterales bacterium]
MKKEDKVKKAVALKYERGKDAAPKVTAKGRGAVAEKILALARQNRIPIEQDSTLMEAPLPPGYQ